MSADSTAWPLRPGTRCDFCLSEAVPPWVNIKPAARVIAELIDGRFFIDDEDWGACKECGVLIGASRWSELLDRCVMGVMAFWNGPDTLETRRECRARLAFTLQGVFGDNWPDELCL